MAFMTGGLAFNGQGKAWERRSLGFRQYVDRYGRIWGRARSQESSRGIIGYEAEVYIASRNRAGRDVVKSTFKIGSLGIRNKRDAEVMAMRFIREHTMNDHNAIALY